MNPSDDEDTSVVDNEQSVAQSQEEIEEFLEPKAIPDEHIVRHAERNDSYREVPTTDDEVIIQPPLDSEVQDKKVEDVATTPTEPEPEGGNISEIISEIAPEITEEVLPVPEALSVEVPQHEEAHILQPIPEQPSAPLDGPTVYHTISGGPETINDTISEHSKMVVREAPPVGMMYTNAVSGYTIPDPHYVPPDPRGAKISGNFGVVLLLGIVALVGVGVAYAYFYMPATFEEFFSAILIIKNEMFK